MRRGIAAAAGLAALLVLTACSGGATAANPTTTKAGAVFQNPVVAAGADPWVVRDGDRYLLIQSVADRLVVTRSAPNDLTGIGDGTSTTVWTPPGEGPSCKALWAPELHRVGDRWWIYYAATTCDGNNANHRMFALQSKTDDPTGPYEDRGEVGDAAGRWAIDGTRIEWKGAAYWVWSGWPGRTDGRQNLYIARMSAPNRVEGEGVLLSEPDLAWEQTGKPIEEGPEGLVRDGVLRIVYSASGSWTDGYALGMLTLKGADPLDRGAWVKTPQPVFAGTNDVTSPGHASFTTSPDEREPWIVYHAARYPGAGWDRTIAMQRFAFGRGGTPVFGRPVRAGVDLPLPSGQPG